MKTKELKLFIVCILLTNTLMYNPLFAQDEKRDSLKRELKVLKGQTYLNLPVNSTNERVRATISVDNEPLDRFTINLADENPEYWTFFDVSPYQGKTISIKIENVPSRPRLINQDNDKPNEEQTLSAKGLDLIFADSKFPGQDSLYKESRRPQVHFTAQRGWINDPNGLVYHEGEYHMYFQHNPYGWQWGNMHWGHAVSNDLLHWKQLPEAIYPVVQVENNGRGDAAFSGSAVVDPKNTAGFRKNGVDPIIAIYTSTGRGECIKLSYDKGRTFIDYEGNPILSHNGRDPKVFWYEEGQHWVMVVWDSGITKEIGLGQEVALRQHSIYTSPDLKNWEYQSGVSGFFECPELFKLPVEDEPGVSKWIMYDAHGRYVVGDFDGKVFTIEQHFTKYEHGGGYFYASQIFNNTPDGRKIQVGWGRNIINPGMPFNQPQLFPTELKLRKTINGYRLCPTPIAEINTLHKSTKVISDKVIESGESKSLIVDADKPIHVIAEFERGDAPVTLNILGYELKYDNEWEFSVNAPVVDDKVSELMTGPFPPPKPVPPVIYVATSDIFKIEAIVDKNILEFFINDGELYYVTAFNGAKTMKVEASVAANNSRFRPNRKLILRKLEVFELDSIWNFKDNN